MSFHLETFAVKLKIHYLVLKSKVGISFQGYLSSGWENTKAFPSQLSNIISPGCCGFGLGSPPRGTCPEHLTKEASLSDARNTTTGSFWCGGVVVLLWALQSHQASLSLKDRVRSTGVCDPIPFRGSSFHLHPESQSFSPCPQLLAIAESMNVATSKLTT